MSEQVNTGNRVSAETGRHYYGCLFCITGQEDDVIQRINQQIDIRVIAPVRQHYHRKKGVYSIREDRMFPGYVFFVTDDPEFPVRQLEKVDGVMRLVKYDTEEWALTGEDALMVEDLFEYNGLIGFSQGKFIDGRLHISQGFLKRYEREICKVDKRHRTAKIQVRLNNRLIDLWLGYEAEDDDTLPQRSDAGEADAQ